MQDSRVQIYTWAHVCGKGQICCSFFWVCYTTLWHIMSCRLKKMLLTSINLQSQPQLFCFWILFQWQNVKLCATNRYNKVASVLYTNKYNISPCSTLRFEVLDFNTVTFNLLCLSLTVPSDASDDLVVPTTNHIAGIQFSLNEWPTSFSNTCMAAINMYTAMVLWKRYYFWQPNEFQTERWLSISNCV